MKRIFATVLIIGILYSCNTTDEAEFVKPKDYLPAYPGSFWTYTNGTRIKVSPSYVEHQYRKSMLSDEKTEKKQVPFYNGQYLYEYNITQNSTVFPLKTILSEKVGSTWQINILNNKKIMRQTISIKDSIPISNFGTKDTVWFANVIEVVEFYDSATADNWYLKEFYAKNVGLIRKDINNPHDTMPYVTESEIIDFHINK